MRQTSRKPVASPQAETILSGRAWLLLASGGSKYGIIFFQSKLLRVASAHAFDGGGSEGEQRKMRLG
jgi:hypothetical protein